MSMLKEKRKRNYIIGLIKGREAEKERKEKRGTNNKCNKEKVTNIVGWHSTVSIITYNLNGLKYAN